jgi:hypothetical protein
MKTARTFAVEQAGCVSILVEVTLEAVLESMDPFSSRAAQAHYERVRAARGW